MRKWSKLILAVMLVAMALSVFVACNKVEEVKLTFVSGEKQYATTIGIDEAKKILETQPSRDGYVFKGWYLDKDTWTQEVKSENIEEITKGNKTISVYAYWVEIVNRITVSFRDYTDAVLLEKDYERSDDMLAKDMASLRPSKRADDEQFTYTFDKWECDTSDLTQAYFVATPKYTSQLRYFDFNYYVDGELIYTDRVMYGLDADKDLVADPQKPSSDKFDYVFTGWDGKFENITQDTNVYAKFQEKIKKFNVTFKYGNDKSKTFKVDYGANAIAPDSSEIARQSTRQYSYIFVGWDNSFENIKADTVVNAKYTQQVRMYDVRFWIDNTCVKYVNVPYGSSVEPPSQPVKDLNDGFTYKFLGWDIAFDNVESNLDVRARFEQISYTYTVDYVNWDGEPLYSEQVESGQPSNYGADIPTRQSNDKYDYVFAGWSDGDKLSAITRNLTVVAQFNQRIKTFSVTFHYGDSKQSTFNSIEYGTDFSKSNLVPTDVTKASTAEFEYEFIGWDGTFDNITANTVINAKYAQSVRSYEVKFFVDETCVKSISALYGSSVDAPEQPVKSLNDGFTYKFTGWDKDFDNIVGDTVVNAIFEKIANTYTVQYVNWDGSLLYTDYVESQCKSQYVGDIPTREPNDKYTYEFIGWTNQDALESVTGSFAAQAQYREVVRTYTVTFNYGHGLKKVLNNISYGENLIGSGEIPTDTDKASTAQYDFTFIDWDKYFGYVSSDMVVNAIYKETIRKYVVTFINNSSILKTQEVEYGSCPTAPTDNIFKNDTLQWHYTFLGWDIADSDIVESADDFIGVSPNQSQVQGEIVYTAIYLREIQKYTVKFFNEEGEKEPIGEITVDYGTDVLAENLAPLAFKESTPKFDYVFTQWNRNDDLAFVAANFETYAQYEANIRSYKVKFMNDVDIYEEYTVEYGSASPKPENDPTLPSTLQYDFVFLGWDGLMSYVEGDVTVTANYRNDLRYYKVTYFNLATYELISTVEMGYGSKITTTIVRDGYDFDSWYRDPDCNTVFDMENETVDGTMMLFGNVVMSGLRFNDKNEIIGYEGATPNLIIPIAANGKKVNTIKEEAFKNNSVIASVYIPSTISKVETFAFSGLNLTDTGGIYVQSAKGITGAPSGWALRWNWNSTFDDSSSKQRPVTFGVAGLYIVGDFQYMLFNNDNTASIDRFVNNNTAKAYIDDELDHQKAFFTKDVEVDKTGAQFDIYSIDYTTTTYKITQIAVSAFEGCENVSKIFIPKTIKKVNNYAFSGVTADVYIAKEKPALESTAWSVTGTSKWNDNRSGQEGTRTLYWGVIDMERVGDYSYIFMSNGNAIATEYHGSSVATSVDVPASVVFRDVVYTVTELGDELFANMSLLSKVKLNEGLKKIGSKVFYMDIVLKTVVLPSTLEEIGAQAFVAAMALNEIYIPANVSKIGSLAFIGIDNLTIYCGTKKTAIGTAPVGYSIGWNTKIGFGDLGDLDLSSILKSLSTILSKFTQTHDVVWNVAGLPQTDSVGSALQGTYKYILYNDGHAELIETNIPAGSFNTSYTIPEAITYNDAQYKVTTIKAGAFAGNTRIKELIIPTSVTSIEENAFQGCSSLVIKTAHESKPSGWNSNFNPDGRDVQYGYGAIASVEGE